MLAKEIDIIERFFQLDLNEEELQSFQKRLKDDSDFNTKVEQYELAKNTAYELFLPGHQDVLRKQKEAMQEIPVIVPEKKTISLGKWWIGLAASISLLLAAAYFMMPAQNMNFAQAQLAAQQTAHESINLDALNKSGTRSHENENIHPVLEAYQSQDFDKVVALSDSYVNQADILLLRGLAFAKNGQQDEAIDSFNALLSLPSGQKDTALWWLTTIYLDQDNPTKAKTYLQQIIDGKFPSARKATELINQF